MKRTNDTNATASRRRMNRHAEINYSLSIAFNATSSTSYEIRYNIEYTVCQTRFYTYTMYIRLMSNSTVLIVGYSIFTAQSFGRCSLLFIPLWNNRMWTMNCSVWLCFSLATTTNDGIESQIWSINVCNNHVNFEGYDFVAQKLNAFAPMHNYGGVVCFSGSWLILSFKVLNDLKSNAQTRQHVMIHIDYGGT